MKKLLTFLFVFLLLLAIFPKLGLAQKPTPYEKWYDRAQQLKQNASNSITNNLTKEKGKIISAIAQSERAYSRSVAVIRGEQAAARTAFEKQAAGIQAGNNRLSQKAGFFRDELNIRLKGKPELRSLLETLNAIEKGAHIARNNAIPSYEQARDIKIKVLEAQIATAKQRYLNQKAHLEAWYPILDRTVQKLSASLEQQAAARLAEAKKENYNLSAFSMAFPQVDYARIPAPKTFPQDLKEWRLARLTKVQEWREHNIPTVFAELEDNIAKWYNTNKTAAKNLENKTIATKVSPQLKPFFDEANRLYGLAKKAFLEEGERRDVAIEKICADATGFFNQTQSDEQSTAKRDELWKAEMAMRDETWPEVETAWKTAKKHYEELPTTTTFAAKEQAVIDWEAKLRKEYLEWETNLRKDYLEAEQEAVRTWASQVAKGALTKEDIEAEKQSLQDQIDVLDLPEPGKQRLLAARDTAFSQMGTQLKTQLAFIQTEANRRTATIEATFNATLSTTKNTGTKKTATTLKKEPLSDAERQLRSQFDTTLKPMLAATQKSNLPKLDQLERETRVGFPKNREMPKGCEGFAMKEHYDGKRDIYIIEEGEPILLLSANDYKGIACIEGTIAVSATVLTPGPALEGVVGPNELKEKALVILDGNEELIFSLPPYAGKTFGLVTVDRRNGVFRTEILTEAGTPNRPPQAVEIPADGSNDIRIISARSSSENADAR